MIRKRSSESRGPTEGEQGKPHTSELTDEQIRDQQTFRNSSRFPPAPPKNDIGVHDAVEREGWDRLKPQPDEDEDKPPE